ncbi:DUF4236 domain-containing protein [Streptomyces sp. NEAU-174]|uniref:DUF4236 domain-containing protein n=1 Tax=Streptomyces sp. NEAU-174 TaxID=3458254 RepID=UPI00404484FB
MITFRKSIRIFRWLTVNLNGRSWSITLGARGGPRHTISSTGRRTSSMDLPGPFGWRHNHRWGRRR